MLEVKDIHKPFCAYLDKEGIPYLRARSDKKVTICVGHPDFSIFLAQRVLFIECKVPGKKLDQAQETRITQLRKAGNVVKVAFSLDEAVCVVREFFGIEMNPLPELTNASSEPSVSSGNEDKVGSLDCIATDNGKASVEQLQIGNFKGEPWVHDGKNLLRRATPQDLSEIRTT